MLGECAWCGGPLFSQFAVTVLGPWLRTYERERGVQSGTMPVWCSVPCREASGSPALGSLVYPETTP
jgi:hypothetical protein